MISTIRKQGTLTPVTLLTMEEKVIAKVFLKAIEIMKKSGSSGEILDAIKDGDAARVIATIRPEKLTETLNGVGLSPEEKSYFDHFVASVRKEASVATTLLPVSIQQVIRFDPISDKTISFLRQYQFERIQGITQETADAIRTTAVRSITERIHPGKSAKEVREIIRGSIGLTSRQAQAVQNFRAALEAGDEKVLNRKLGILDRKVTVGALKHKDQKRIDNAVRRYEERLLNHRASMIARTESTRAESAGRQLLWEQGVEQGVINTEKARKFWVVSKDERLCQICKPIPGDNKDGVPIDGNFITPVGNLAYSPAHPYCRCTIVLRFGK